MTNLDTTPSDAPQSTGRRRLRPVLKGILAAAMAVLGIGVFATPAFAHSNSVTGVASCPSGATQTITWTIANDYQETETATVTSTTDPGGLATVSPTSVNIALSPVGTPPANYQTGTVTQTLPATTTGSVTITVQGLWSDGTIQIVTGTATLAANCSGPSIGVSKSVSPSTVQAGSSTPVVYSLAVNNSGQLPTTSDVVVTDAIPVNTTYVLSSATCGTTPSCSIVLAPGLVTFTIGAPIYGGVTDTVSFAVTVNQGTPSGTIPNTALYTGPGCVPTAPATTCSTNTVLVTVTNPFITVVKSANVTNVSAGQSAPVIYTLTVANNSTQSTAPTITDVTVSDVVPSGLTFVSASCGALNAGSTPSCTSQYNTSTSTVSFALGAGIAVGASYPLTFQATVNANDTTSIDNSATWTGPGCTPTAPATTCSTNHVIITVANFSVSKADSDGSNPVNPGDVITYTLSPTNIGTGPGSITVTDSAPTGTTLATPAPACPASTTSTCSVAVSGSDITWTITNLPAGTTYDLTFSVTVNAGTGGTDIRNTGHYTGPGCTTAGGCSTNTTDNPVPPPTSVGNPPPTPPTTPATPVPATPAPAVTDQVIEGATTVHTGEPFAGSKPYVLAVLAFGLGLLGLGGARRRRALKAPTA